MLNLRTWSRPIGLFTTILLITASLTFTGCTADTLTGADLKTYETSSGSGEQTGGGTSPVDEYNEGQKTDSGGQTGGGTSPVDEYNE